MLQAYRSDSSTAQRYTARLKKVQLSYCIIA